MRTILLAAALTLAAGSVSAGVTCKAVALRSVSSAEPSANGGIALDPADLQYARALRRGQILEDVVVVNVDRATGESALCVRNNPCFPASAMRLLNCHVEKRAFFSDAYTVSFGVTPNRR